MGERVSSCRGFLELAKDVILGPITEGVVVDIKIDSYDPDWWHTLVRTADGELKHFSSLSGMRIVTKDSTIRLKHVEMSMYPKIGDPYKIRTRGVIHTPGSKIDKNPFNLQESKPE